MSGWYDFAGLVAGLAGAALFVAGALAAFGAAVRLAAVRRRAGQGRMARGLLAAAAVACAAGAGLFWASEVAPFRGALDRHAGTLAAAAVVLSVIAGWRNVRRQARRLDSAPAAAVAALGANGERAADPGSGSPRA